MQKIIRNNYKLGFLLLIIILSVIGSTLIYYSTNWGPWAFSDSAAYISSAKNLNLGLGLSLISAKGIVTPLEVFPPLYPLSLSLIANLGLDYLTAARVLDTLLFGLLIFIFTLGIMTFTKNFWLALTSGLLVLFSPVMFDHYGGVMTEPLFITLFYASFFLTLIYIQNQKPLFFVLAVLCTGISPLVRYVGVFTCAVNLLLILLFDKSDWRRRWIKGFVFGIFSVLPILVWFILTYTNSRTLGAHTIVRSSDLITNLLSFFKGSGKVFQSWLPYMQYRVELFPDQLKSVFFIIITLIIFSLGIFFYLKFNHQRQSNPVIQLMIASFLTNIIYIFVFCAIYLFADPTPPIISRMFSPILPSLVLWISCGLIFFLEQVPERWKTYSMVIITFLVVVQMRYYFLRSLAIAKEYHENGYGYTAYEIQTSGFIQAVKELPSDISMIANTPAMVLLYTNRMPYPLDYIPTTTFGTRKSDTEILFTTQHSPLILDYASIRNVYPDWEERLASFTNGLMVAYKDNIGGIYYFPPGNSP